MQYNKVDLSAIAAIGHDGINLNILVARGENQFESVITPAPPQALEGILRLNQLCCSQDTLDNITMIPVNSTTVAAIGYSKSFNVLQIDFIAGTRYRYFSVPYSVFELFQIAPSKGKFLSRYIKRRYDYQLVD